MRLVVCALFAVACGGSSEPTQRAGTGVSAIATQQGAGDVVVAQVNGRPVWGSCVTAQSKGKAKQAALDECVAFELLAQAAEQRGLQTDPEVVDATRTALVNRVVEVGFEDRFKSPADMADILAKHVERNKDKLARPELRASIYARLPDQTAEPPAKLVELAAKLRDETGLMAPQFKAIANEVFGDVKYQSEDVGLFPKANLVDEYANALFDIKEIGRIYPKPVRSKFGWDVILMTNMLPAKTYTREEAAAEAFPEVRTAYFNAWVDQVARSLGVKIDIDRKQLPKLEELGP